MTIERFIKEEMFYHYFQPIYDMGSWRRIGYEVLLRSSFFSNPECTFYEAKKAKRLYDLDSRSIHKALSTYHSVGVPEKDEILFVNVFPSTILHQSFPSFLNQIITEMQLTSQQIVLEISETEIIGDQDAFKKRINEIKGLGFLIAIDDVGKGYSNIQSVIEFEPDYVKLDRYFSNDLHLSKQKQSMISLFLCYCKENNIQVVLEGLENEVEVAMAKALGVPIAQGYILGKPALLQETV